jgi:hypothetical protein
MTPPNPSGSAELSTDAGDPTTAYNKLAHDLFGVSLDVYAARRLATDDEIRQRLTRAVDALDAAIRDLRVATQWVSDVLPTPPRDPSTGRPVVDLVNRGGAAEARTRHPSDRSVAPPGAA